MGATESDMPWEVGLKPIKPRSFIEMHCLFCIFEEIYKKVELEIFLPVFNYYATVQFLKIITVCN